MTTTKEASLVPVESITNSILVVRGYRVIVDSDLAMIYGVTTKRLNQAVKRNLERFPADFMIRLTPEEVERSRTHSATPTGIRGHNLKYPPRAFTEHGAIQAANVLNSPRAVQMGIHVVRAFVHLRGLLANNKEVAQKFAELERKLDTHDQAITGILKTIYELLNPDAQCRGIRFAASFKEGD
jgi:hypothetical protein